MAGATLEGATSAPLAPALAASIALHAALLAGLPEVWTLSDPSAPPPLTAWLAPGVQPAPIAEPASAEASTPAIKPAPQPRRAGVAKPPPTVREVASAVERNVPAPVAAPIVQATPEERVSVAASAPAAAPKSGPAPARAETSVALAAPAGEAPPDLGSLAQYRLALIGAASRHKPYPPRAIDRGWQGRVVLRLVISADGELARALVQRSSGHDVLDRQALEMFRKAHAATPIPPALRNREFPLEVAVAYELKDGR
jgi:periplasmic protein TonB